MQPSARTLQEKSKLQKNFGRRDIFFFLVCTLVGIDGLGMLATQGGAGFTWMIGPVLLFAVPSALLLAELGAGYPAEGGPYVWVQMAFGRLPAAINTFLYWVSNPVWLGGTIVAAAAGGLDVFFHGGRAYSTAGLYAVGLPFIWAGVLVTVFSFRVGRWVVAVGALVPLILCSLVGFELPSAAGEEMVDAPHDVPSGIAKSFTSGLTWIMGSDRALAISCLDGAGPSALSGFSARFGTPVRVNVLSGFVATAVFVLAERITGGNAYKFFSVSLRLAISTTLMSYLAIFPAAWALRRRRPADPRPFRAPAIGLLTVLSTALVVFCTVESLFPGLGDGWFTGPNLPSSQWSPDERWTYLAAAGLPLVGFVVIGASFWAVGARQREAL